MRWRVEIRRGREYVFSNTYGNVFDNTFFPAPNHYPFSTQGTNSTPSGPSPPTYPPSRTIYPEILSVSVQVNKATSPAGVGGIVSKLSTLRLARRQQRKKQLCDMNDSVVKGGQSRFGCELCGCRERSVSKYEGLDARDRRKGVKCVKVKVKVNGDVRI
jgi:hypothetical protein